MWEYAVKLLCSSIGNEGYIESTQCWQNIWHICREEWKEIKSKLENNFDPPVSNKEPSLFTSQPQ